MRPNLGEQQDEGPVDRRKQQRWNIPIPVRVRGVGSDGTPFEEETITTDASPSGMCLLLTVPLEIGAEVSIAAPEEGFDTPATVVHVSALGLGMTRVRVHFPGQKKLVREAAPKRYVYDYSSENWVGYIMEGVYYNSKHEPFGKVEGKHILSLAAGAVLFTMSSDRVLDGRGNCIGHLV